jgi:hypothetical protein
MRQSRSSLRSSRLTQQQQQAYQAPATQQQLISYHASQDYTMDIQTSSSGQLQLALPDQSNQHAQVLIAHQQQQQQQQQQQHRQQQQQSQQTQQIQKQMKSTTLCKPYVKIANHGYKFPPPVQTFDAQQCKFTSNNIKVRNKYHAFQNSIY